MSDFDREERAFTDALRTSLEGEEFRPLDPERVIAAARRQPRVGRPWLKGLAAAASVVLVVGAAAVILPRMIPSAASGSAASRVEAEPAAAGAQPSYVVAGTDAGGKASASPTTASAQWRTTATSPLSPRMRASVTWLDGRYYVVGGVSEVSCGKGGSCPEANYLSDGAAYDPSTDTWSRIADAPVGIAILPGHGRDRPVVVGGRLYFLLTDATFLSYDPATDVWTTLPAAATDGTLVAAGERVIEVANDRTRADVPIDRIYDPATATWTMLPSDPLVLLGGRNGVVAGNRLVVSLDTSDGGFPADQQLAVLDLDTLTWQVIPRNGVDPDAVAVNDLVVWSAIGPTGGILDPATGSWARLPSLPKHGIEDTSFRGVVAAGRIGVGDWLLDPVARTWTAIPDPRTGAALGMSVAGGSDGVFLFGGWTGKAYTARALYLRIG